MFRALLVHHQGVRLYKNNHQQYAEGRWNRRCVILIRTQKLKQPAASNPQCYQI